MSHPDDLITYKNLPKQFKWKNTTHVHVRAHTCIVERIKQFLVHIIINVPIYI